MAELEAVRRINAAMDAASRATILIETAEAAAAAGDLAKAAAQLREAVELSPSMIEAHFRLAAVLDNSTEAEAALRRVLDLNPRHAAAHFRLGMLLHSSERREASEELSRAVELAPGMTEAHRLLARVAMQSRDAPASERHWTAVAAWIPEDAETIRNLQGLAGRN